MRVYAVRLEAFPKPELGDNPSLLIPVSTDGLDGRGSLVP